MLFVINGKEAEEKMNKFFCKKIYAAMLILAVVIFLNCASVFAAGEELDRETVFTQEELEYIENCGTLKVGYVQDRMPVSFKDENGEMSGISRDIFDRIAEISGLDFEYAAIPEGNVTYTVLLDMGLDLITSVEYNEENQKARGILISDPYLSRRKVIVAREGFQFDADDHCKVAISTGSQTLRKVLLGYYPNYELVDYPSIVDCFDAVNNGEADLLIQNQYIVEHWLYKPLYDKLKLIPIIDFDDKLCFSAVTPLEKTDDEMWHEKEMQISIINKSIAQISTAEISGIIITSMMENKYEFTFADLIYQYRYTFIVIGVAVVLICIMIHVNIKMHLRSVHDRADAKAKGDFLSAMSHEIRTPLNGLIGLNYMMEQNLDDKKKMSDYLKQSSSVAKYLLSLVNNILDMSKIQENKMEFEHKPVDLSALLNTIETMEKSGMSDKKIAFSIEHKLEYPAVFGDEMRIQQILVNMLDNARKYTHEGGEVTVKAVQEKMSDNEIRTTLTVTDNGQGMSEEFQQRIFDPFTQERNTVSMGNQGTGLGMAICSLLAKSMGGSLSVESKTGVGSTFTFVFTSDPAELSAVMPSPEKSTNTVHTAEKPHILIVEDNELNGQILVEILTQCGYKATHATDGKKAVEVFEASEVGEYGIILMDLLMPEMNGFEASTAIRSLKRDDASTVKIIACTANSFKEDRDKAMESGMNDFVAKPIDIKLLLSKLESHALYEQSDNKHNR